MSAPSHSAIDLTTSPPTVTVPRAYNATVDLVDRHVDAGRGDKIAFIDDRGSLSYGELASRVNRAANSLVSLGVRSEERALLCLLDTNDFPTIFLGAIKAGIIPVPVNTLLTSADYQGMLDDSRARVLFVSDALFPKLREAARTSRWLEHVVVVSSPLGSPDPTARESAHDFDTLLEEASDVFTAAPTTADDVAFWLYSSGSTGAPKGALHLHAHLIQTAALYGQGVLGIEPSDRIFSAAKLFFAYGLGNALTFPLSVGATSVLMAERPTPKAVLRVLHDHEPTIFGGVPTLFASLLAELADAPGPIEHSLRRSLSAGEALPKHLGERWREMFGTDILDGIGSTEMLHIFLSNLPGEVRYGTTGKPVPGYELKLVDEAGTPTPDGEEGSLWVKGPSCSIAYWNNRERSVATFHGPWTRTGDRYVRDADGFYTYSGRADDMLKVGGIWVSPFEVESALTAHDAVLEAAVVGHADVDGLIKPKAFVVLKRPTDASVELVEALKGFVKSRLAPFKYPRWIEIVGELPKTATGKIQRFKLRA